MTLIHTCPRCNSQNCQCGYDIPYKTIMNYNFNKTLVEELRNGEICVKFNPEKDSLEMLQALLDTAFPFFKEKTNGSFKFYKVYDYNKSSWWPTNIINETITPIPLSNFVQHEQSERDIMVSFDERLKRLETLLDEVLAKETPESLKEWLSSKRKQSEPTWAPKAGEWFKDMLESLYYCTVSNENGVEGDNQNGGTISCTLECEFTKPTDKEVEDYMVELGKEKGFVKGVSYSWPNKPKICDEIRIIKSDLQFNIKDNILLDYANIIWDSESGWPELVNPVRWRAEKGGKYNALTIVNGQFIAVEYIEVNVSGDNNYYNSGNYFQTTQQAEEMAVLMQFTLNNPDKVKKIMNDGK